MNTNIEIIPASLAHYEAVLELVKKECAAEVSNAKEKYGAGIADVMESLREPKCPKNTDSGYVAVSGGKIVGYADYNSKNDGSAIGDIGFSVADPDFDTTEITTALFSVIIDKMRGDEKKLAHVHASLGNEALSFRRALEAVRFTRGLPEIMYYAELANLPAIRVNADIKIVPLAEEHIEVVKKIAAAGWSPIRKVQKSLLGEEIYAVLFHNWEEAKCRAIMNASFANPAFSRGYVALCDGVVAGFVTARYSVERKLITIANNSVSPDFAGKGIGSTLYNFILTRAKDDGLLYANVLTGLDDAHAPARRAYEKAGFRRDIALEHIEYYMSI